MRFSLFKKIILWFFLNLALVGAVFLLIFGLGIPRQLRFFGGGMRLEPVARLIAIEVQNISRDERDAVLRKYSEVYKAEFTIFDNDDGTQLGGREIILPAEIVSDLRRPPPPLPRNAPDERNTHGIQPGPAPMFVMRSRNPTLFWLGVRMPLFEKDNPNLHRATLLIASESPTGNGLFFDSMPWFVVGGLMAAFSVLLWLPFVRGLTRNIGEMTRAAEQIAEEKFDVRVDEKRTDELGRLGKAINHLAGRLSGFVHGQKRFLGDISHELNSPLARMQFALSVLEDNIDESKREYVDDVREEVELMSKLVNELLAYSKAGIKKAEINLENVHLRPLVLTVVAREDKAQIKIEIPEHLEVRAQPELLSRAVANIVRNAVRYAGDAGEIKITAKQTGSQIEIIVADRGAGVPESELEKLFDPFYRLETDRARKTGGTGLGLAIVKTCVESCGGKVFARNIESGFEVVIELAAGS